MLELLERGNKESRLKKKLKLDCLFILSIVSLTEDIIYGNIYF